MPSGSLISERVAILEERILILTQQEARRYAQELERDRKIDALIDEMGKYKGFIGGVLFVGSCVWAFLKLGVPVILKLIGKN